jgi:hypothetical protein
MKGMSIASLPLWTMAAGAFAYPSTAGAATATLPSKSEVLAVMSLVGDYARTRYPAPVEAYWDDGVGNKVFRFRVTGKNNTSSGFATAIDYVMLTKR